MGALSKRKILCVDDNPEWLALATRWLMGQDYDVIAAGSSLKALELLGPEKPDLILFNVVSPLEDGHEFCDAVRTREDMAQVPIVFLTSACSEQGSGQVREAGAVDYLVKPVGKDELLEAVARHLPVGQAHGPSRTFNKRPQGHVRAFLEYLCTKLRVSPQNRSRLESMTAENIYSLAPEFGIDEDQLACLLAAYSGHAYVPWLDPREVEPGVLHPAFCKEHRVLLIKKESGRRFALSNPLDLQLLDALKNLLPSGQQPVVVVASPGSINAVLECLPTENRLAGISASRRTAVFGSKQMRAVAPENEPHLSAAPVHEFSRKTLVLKPGGPALPPPAHRATMADLQTALGRIYKPDEEEVIEDEASEESPPLIELVNRIIEQACEARASDIHVEPWERGVIVRYRIDGDLRVVMRLRPQKLIQPLAARIKIMSNLDITERRLPQDGRIAFKEQIDLRVATSPMHFGEKVVMRILDKRKAALPLAELGFSERNLRLYNEKIRSPYGMILHVGPTGSGKSMSLFAALREIQRPELNIQTIEDPIEYTLPGINQMQTHEQIGLTFARGLRSYLRQDPDIILVGEIRDRETANAAVEAALTGHLVLSTLHTNDAAATIIRFIEMGIEQYLVSSTIIMICAQRLLRRLCSACKESYAASPQMRLLAGAGPDEELVLHRARGCKACGGVGYKERVGTHEILALDDALRTALGAKGITAEALKRLAVEHSGMTTLFWDAMEKARQGITSVEEVLAEVRKDEFDSRPGLTPAERVPRVISRRNPWPALLQKEA